MKHELPKLDYSYDSLEPYIDMRTMEIHHTKHHQAYVDKLNKALEKYPELQKESVENLIKNLQKIPEDIRTTVRNNGGGHLNHSFFWKILKKGTKPSEKFLKEIKKNFESLEKFKEIFFNEGMNRFGSGWVWLVLNKEKKLVVISTPNQDNPLIYGLIPIIGLDLWEHAYYLKYQNRRNEYIEAFWNVLNWEQVEKNLSEAKNK
ncbi:MAG: superoxide dismutase [Candidatus Pacearchaeota archaeon]